MYVNNKIYICSDTILVIISWVILGKASLCVLKRYGLGVGISIVFEIFSNFLFLGVGLTTGAIFSNFLFLGVGLTPGAIPNVLHILPVTQETRIYI
jgi:hypothetical protein